MTEHEEYTLPPGMRVASNQGANPTKLQPVLIDPSIDVVEGDVPTRQADGSWIPQAASGGGGGVLVVTVSLSAAQLNALGDTEIVAVPVTDASAVIVPLSLTTRYVAGATPFSFAGSPGFGLGPAGGGFRWLAMAVQGVFDQASDQVAVETYTDTATPSNATQAVGKALTFSISSALSAGNGSAVCTIAYYLALAA